MAFPCFNSIADADRSERESRDMEREAAIEQMAAELEPGIKARMLADGEWISGVLYCEPMGENAANDLLAEAVAGAINPITRLRVQKVAEVIAASEAAKEAWQQAEREIDARDPLDDLNF